jgi:hypothetical protein
MNETRHKMKAVGQKDFRPRRSKRDRAAAGVAGGGLMALVGSQSDQRPALSAWARKQIRIRRKNLEAFDEMVAGGMAKSVAAKILRTSLVSLWRHRKRLVPIAGGKGRVSLFKRLGVLPQFPARVERLQIERGLSNAEAWRAIATRRDCPAPLAAFLQTCNSIPLSFLRESKIRKVPLRAKLFYGHSFAIVLVTQGKP